MLGHFFPVTLDRRDRYGMKTPCLGAVPLTRVDPRPAGSAQLADVQEGWGGGQGPLVTPQRSSPRDTSPLVPPLLCQPPFPPPASSKAEKASPGPFCEGSLLARTELLRYRLAGDALSVDTY